MDGTLTELFRHNLWANLRLLDACEGLSDEQLDAAATGTYGRLRDTLLHILACEEVYVNLLTGQEPVHTVSPGAGFPGFEELRQRASRSGEELVRIAAGIDPTQVLRGTWRTRPHAWKGKPFAIQASIPLIQAINHGTEHRSHVVTILSQLGVKTPMLDAWGYGYKQGMVEVG
ncbi:MAG: DinB family protein [Dehalococcoidia bacterium]|nr:DinB family protein [Dehalococcoidia bacterium]